ncbi:ATP-binding cassette transporter CGR1, partial [Oleoguttula sp. CCFEE 5521]
NVLFKVSYPAEFHSQTAVEAAQRLNKKLAAMGKTAADIDHVVNRTHEACIRIIDKQHKPMDNFADRDHCVQYMVANIRAIASPRIAAPQYLLRGRPTIHGRNYHDPEKRTIANALTVTLKDGTVLDEEVVEAPLGHRLRREEAKPEILEKYRRHLEPHFPAERTKQLVDLGNAPEKLYAMPVDEYVDLYAKERIL